MQKLQNMKIRIKDSEHSKQVQECLFKLGFGWGFGGAKIASFTPNFIYCYKDGLIRQDSDEIYFDEHNNPEVTLEDLQAMVAEPDVKPKLYSVPSFPLDNTINTYMSQIQKRLADVNITINIYADEIRVANLDNDNEAVVDNWDEVLEAIKVKQAYLNVFKGSN